MMKGIGQNFDDFLKEQGIYDEVCELAKRKQEGIRKSEKGVVNKRRKKGK